MDLVDADAVELIAAGEFEVEKIRVEVGNVLVLGPTVPGFTLRRDRLL
jgi:hypothetical protein